MTLLSGCTSLIPGRQRTLSPEETLRLHKALISALFSGETRAASRSKEDWVDYFIAHNYPGSFDEKLVRACHADPDPEIDTFTLVPDLSTLRPTPDWVGPPRDPGQKEWLFAGKKPEGVTYSLVINMTYAGFEDSETVHVTILDGKAYYFSGRCNPS